ncbi:MAG: phenylacetate-CoA oxygenase subunit PaaC, partial [Chitinophagaceae bacterium]|nr:phenylacetate-CoA oxygenase subunit PaaC [Chitinophagaceae bacterium]
GDWGQTILRQFLYSRFQYYLYEKLQEHPDTQIAAIAAKSIKETTYHLRWSSEWVIRLGDGTAESHERMQNAIDNLWPYTGEMFLPADFEADVKIDFSGLKNKWLDAVTSIVKQATLSLPENENKVYMHTGGKEGRHTEHLGYILTELQYMQMAFPGANW